MIGRSDFMFDSLLLKISVDMFLEFRSSVGANSFDLGAEFRFEGFGEELEVHQHLC